MRIIKVRPSWKDKTQFSEIQVAQVRWVASRQVWRLYWMWRDLRWHSYPGLPETKTLEEALAEVDEILPRVSLGEAGTKRAGALRYAKSGSASTLAIWRGLPNLRGVEFRA